MGMITDGKLLSVTKLYSGTIIDSLPLLVIEKSLFLSSLLKRLISALPSQL